MGQSFGRGTRLPWIRFKLTGREQDGSRCAAQLVWFSVERLLIVELQQQSFEDGDLVVEERRPEHAEGEVALYTGVAQLLPHGDQIGNVLFVDLTQPLALPDTDRRTMVSIELDVDEVCLTVKAGGLHVVRREHDLPAKHGGGPQNLAHRQDARDCSLTS